MGAEKRCGCLLENNGWLMRFSVPLSTLLSSLFQTPAAVAEGVCCPEWRSESTRYLLSSSSACKAGMGCRSSSTHSTADPVRSLIKLIG